MCSCLTKLKASLEEPTDKLPMVPMCGGSREGGELQTNKLNLEFIKHHVTVIKRKIDCMTCFLKMDTFLFYVYGLLVCLSVHHTHVVRPEAKRGHSSPLELEPQLPCDAGTGT